MLTTDLALRMDPIYEPISRRFGRVEDRVQLATEHKRADGRTLLDKNPLTKVHG